MELNKQNNKATHVSGKVSESSTSSSHVETPPKSSELPVNLYVHVLINELRQEATQDQAPLKQWSIFFPKLKRGQSTFSTFSSREQIKSKNDNALIIDISRIQNNILTF
ncbi:10441_t:CDS:1 [Dentiscutata erythropus]|uniref:10441_t:CDS:1 n=1 Tax=Dentiscutata erythropus TaxID=1348616 RepID=A0A9N9IR83_9GLOM|nr:10441_t:CDS:1 [Dentiscutata erythropus]